ncbi:ISL3 family transposase, partial [Chloroflexota bacterium]
MNLPFELPGFIITQVSSNENELTITAEATSKSARCPKCQDASKRIHSYYNRSPKDLPVSDKFVQLNLIVRRFRCINEECSRKTFVERLPKVVPFYGRRTKRFTKALREIGFALGGEAGSRLATDLRMKTSPDTLIRIVREFPTTNFLTPRVLGVDDFALQKGRIYGTLLVDLELRQPIDLLSDRTAGTLAEWLRLHPGVQIITRDRSTEYARGAAEGAPKAIQVADRWHLLKNLREALERMLNRLHADLRLLPCTEHTPEASITAGRLRVPAGRELELQQAKRDRRFELYQRVKALYNEGTPILQIAKRLGMSRPTVRNFAYAQEFPERVKRRPVPSLLDPYVVYLQQRMNEGCENASQLWREICDQGFNGGRKLVARWVQQHRASPGKFTPTKYLKTSDPKVTNNASTTENLELPVLDAPRKLVWVLLHDVSQLNSKDTATLARIRQNSEVEKAYALSRQFQDMVRARASDSFDLWLEDCIASGIVDLNNFALGMKRDYSAIRAALTQPWSNGQVEGQTTRLK